LWDSVNYGQSLHGLHNTKNLRTPGVDHRQGGPCSRLDRLLPIGSRAERGPALPLRKLTFSIEAVCAVAVRRP